MKKILVTLTWLSIASATTMAQLVKTPSVQKVLTVIPSVNELAGLVSSSSITQLEGYMEFIDPVTNERTIPRYLNHEYVGTPDIRILYRSVTDQSKTFLDFVAFSTNNSFYFNRQTLYYKYVIKIKPNVADPGVNGSPFQKNGTIIFNPTQWKLESLALVWRLPDISEMAEAPYDRTLFLDKIITETIPHWANYKMTFLLLDKLASTIKDLPAL